MKPSSSSSSRCPRYSSFGLLASGSETDVSTSNENLSSAEERQEPQGLEEPLASSSHQFLFPSNSNSSPFLLSHDKMLISSSGAYFDPKGVSKANNNSTHHIANTSSGGSLSHLNNGAPGTSSDIISQLTREMRLYSQAAMSGLPVPPRSSPHHLLGQSPQTERALQHHLQQHQQSPRGHSEKQLLLLSRSQPDLPTSDSDLRHDILSPPLMTPNNERRGLPEDRSALSSSFRKSASVNASTNTVASSGFESNAALLTAVESFKEENLRLKGEVEEMNKKVTKVSQLELEMSKIHENYQGLLKHSEKRETLEKNARSKLQNVIQSLSETNKEVTERHESVMTQLMSGDVKNQNIPGLDAILRSEILRKDSLIGQLMNQNKMLISSKERQDVEMNAQRETLEEQRQHIKILDSALSNAQASVLRLEEENRMKEGYADRVKQMTKSLEQLQAASEKREAMEKKLRSKLEEELRIFRLGFQSRGEDDILDDCTMLRHKLSQAEERIIRMESERTHWEQRFLEEAAMRQVAIDAASIPKDAKIAALEKNSFESEKIIAEARSDKMRQFEEMQNTHRKCAELETLVKTLETQLAERDAIIRLIQSQQRTQEGGSSSGQQQHHQHQLVVPSSSSGGFSSSNNESLLIPTSSHHLLPSTSSQHQQHHPLALPPPPRTTAILASPSSLSRLGKPFPAPSPLIPPRFPGMLHSPSIFTPRSSSEVLFKAGLASRSLTPSDLLVGRSLTPTAELLRGSPSSAVAEFKAAAARRDSMPGSTTDVLALTASSRHSSPVPSGTVDIYTGATSVADTSTMIGAGNPSIGSSFIGGTLPKMAMKTEASRTALTSGKFTNNPAFNILMDDSISSIVGSMTPTRIDSGVSGLGGHPHGRRSPRHEPLVVPANLHSSSSGGGASALVASVTSATTADGASASKSYMEVWNV